jgi:hypothetical protein
VRHHNVIVGPQWLESGISTTRSCAENRETPGSLYQVVFTMKSETLARTSQQLATTSLQTLLTIQQATLGVRMVKRNVAETYLLVKAECSTLLTELWIPRTRRLLQTSGDGWSSTMSGKDVKDIPHWLALRRTVGLSRSCHHRAHLFQLRRLYRSRNAC